MRRHGSPRARRLRGRSRPAAVSGVLVAVALLGGCAADQPTDAAPAPLAGAPAATAPAPTGAAGAPVDETAVPDGDVPASLRWTAPLLDGGELLGAELADQPLMLWFWAPT